MTDQPGYYFHPSKYSPPLGYAQLDINLSHVPTDRFFDTKQVKFHIVEDENIVQRTVYHPWHEANQLRVAAGRFSLHAHNGSIIEVFSFGGEVEIIRHDDYSNCRLTSPAPIFNIRDAPQQLGGGLLINELATLVAKRRAAWASNDTGFTRRLSQVDPFQLFVVALTTLEANTHQVPTSARGQKYREVVNAVNRAIRIVKETGEWPASIPSIEDVL